MSAARPTRREITNWLAFARGGPYTLRCERYRLPTALVWVVRSTHTLAKVKVLSINSPLVWWQKRFPQ